MSGTRKKYKNQTSPPLYCMMAEVLEMDISKSGQIEAKPSARPDTSKAKWENVVKLLALAQQTL